MTISRRDFSIRLAAVFAAGLARPAMGQDELAAFRSLSARLTGFTEMELDPELALDMIAGLRAAGDGAGLESLLLDSATGGDIARATRASPLQAGAQSASGNVSDASPLLAGAQLVDGESGELARRITVAWYSGIHPTAEGMSLRTYDDALVWRALEFTKPPGRCAARPGDWSEPPVGRAAAQ